jgi:hypothetical protein
MFCYKALISCDARERKRGVKDRERGRESVRERVRENEKDSERE